MKYILLILLLFGSRLSSAQNIELRSKIYMPGTDLNGVWGYFDGTREYALSGDNEGLAIVDVTDPEAPKFITKIILGEGFSREVRVYGHYAFVSQFLQDHDSLVGIMVVDLSPLPNSNLPAYLYTGDGPISGQLKKALHLEIDEKTGFLYLFATNIGPLLVFDLKTDSYHPEYIATYDQFGSFHDGYVDNDTLFLVKDNDVVVFDMGDKSNPLLINQQQAGGGNHNCWASGDKKTLFLSSYFAAGTLKAYDISDPEDIKFLDEIRPGPNSKNAVYNTYAKGHYAICSWNAEGLVVVNAARPGSLVIAGKYDTYPRSDEQAYVGCLSTYPYFPSGNIIVSNRITYDSNELIILTPNYKEAAYLEGVITNSATQNPLAGASIRIMEAPLATSTSDYIGKFQMGTQEAGTYQLRVSKLGFFPRTISVNMVTGAVQSLNIALTPAPTISFSGSTSISSDGSPLAGIKIRLVGEFETITVNSLSTGNFIIPTLTAGHYDIYIGKWGYRFQFFDDFYIDGTQVLNLSIDKGYEDPFVEGFNFNWGYNLITYGKWTQGKPIVNEGFGAPNASELDVLEDIGDFCFLTGNSTYSGYNNVMDSAMLYSPIMNLSGLSNPVISAAFTAYSYEYSGVLTDSVYFYINNLAEEKLVAVFPVHGVAWKTISFQVKDYVSLSNIMRFKVKAKAGPPEQYVGQFRVAFDNFKVEDETVASQDPPRNVLIQAAPNPFHQSTNIQYDDVAIGSRLLVYDLLGQLVESHELRTNSGQVNIGSQLKPGAYFLNLDHGNVLAKPIKLLKVNN